MILNISIPDEVYTAYGAYSPRPHQAIAAQVKRFQGVDPGDPRTLVLSGEVRTQLEKLSGRTIDTPEELVKVVGELARLRIGEAAVELPEETQKYYAGQAEFQGQPPGEWLRSETLRLLRFNAGQGA